MSGYTGVLARGPSVAHPCHAAPLPWRPSRVTFRGRSTSVGRRRVHCGRHSPMPAAGPAVMHGIKQAAPGWQGASVHVLSVVDGWQTVPAALCAFVNVEQLAKFVESSTANLWSRSVATPRRAAFGCSTKSSTTLVGGHPRGGV